MEKPIAFTKHARQRMQERGAREEDVCTAIRGGQREPAHRGLSLHRFTLEFKREWDGRYYGVQQIAAVVAEEPDRLVVVTVYVLLPGRRSAMKITYDKEADALYIRLLEGEHQCRVVRLTDDIALDFAAGEKLVGVEILGASRLFDKPEEPAVDLKDILPRIVAA